MSRRSAVVLGAGLAGMLTASVLAKHVDEVTVVERDRLPDGPSSRKGVPQSHHGHLLLSGGIDALDELLPGTSERLIKAGARRLGLPNDTVVLSAQGWLPRLPEMRAALSCSRNLLEWQVRERVLRDDRIHVIGMTDAAELCGTSARVTGVRVRNRGTGHQYRLDADLVVDATGMSSRAPEWLRELGAAPVREKVISSKTAYSSRRYLAPPGVRDDFPAVLLRANPMTGQPGRCGSILPIEKGQWLVSVAGTAGAQPPTDIDGFERFTWEMHQGIVGRLLANAAPVDGVRGYRNNVNRRRYFTRVPDGFLALGDSMTTTNPMYGQGASLAARSVLALRDGLARYGFGRGVAAGIQREVLGRTRFAWHYATCQDILFPNAVGRRDVSARWGKRVLDRLQRLAASDPALFDTLLAGQTLSGSAAGALTPRRLARLLGDVPGLPTENAPFTEAEWAALDHQGVRSA